MKHNSLLIAIAVTAAAIGLTLTVGCTGPSGTPEAFSTIPTSESTPTQPSTAATTPETVPLATTPQASVPVISEDEYVGTLYTRSQLDAMDNSRQSLWPGYDHDGKRPFAVTSEQNAYYDYNVHFIGNNYARAHLTFNCGNDPLTTDAEGNTVPHTAVVLDILKNQRIQATFFVTGHFCRTHPDVVQRIIDEGHILGNYGLSSVELPGLSTEEMVAQIMNLHEYVLETFGYTMKHFRPYGGAYSQRTFALASSLGYTSILYSAAYPDMTDASQLNAVQAMEKLTSQIHKGVVIRLHTASLTSVSILEELINTLREEYYSIQLLQPR